MTDRIKNISMENFGQPRLIINCKTIEQCDVWKQQILEQQQFWDNCRGVFEEIRCLNQPLYLMHGDDAVKYMKELKEKAEKLEKMNKIYCPLCDKEMGVGILNVKMYCEDCFDNESHEVIMDE